MACMASDDDDLGAHVLLRTSREAYATAARRLAEDRQVWAYQERAGTADPGTVRLELSVGDATCALEPAEIRAIFAELAGTGERSGG